MSTDSVVSVAWDALKYVVVPIKRQFGYVISSKSYAQDLQKEVGMLENEAGMVHDRVQVARNNCEDVYSNVTQWQANAEKALKEARDLLADFENATKTCCNGKVPEPCCRYQFSRKAKAKIEGIQRLTKECSQLKDKDISRSRPAPGYVAASTTARAEDKAVVPSTNATAFASSASTSTKLKDDDILNSRESIMEKITAALADNSNSVVGIHGMGGVGKSTLLVDIDKRIRKEKSFDWIAKADVSENPDIKRIQGEIADALGLSKIKDQESVKGRAELLHKRLEEEEKQNKKVLIILDNLWERLDLKSVGIPCGHDNKVIGCKLLLTSRFRDLLRREMGCDRDFLLSGLQKEEAERLFQRTVGEKVHDDPFKSLMHEALNKCAGLPFLIIAVANILKDAHFPEWKDVLRQIEMSTNKGISGTINEMLRLTYDRFKGEEGEELKSLLRLCVVYGVSKPSLENLVRYSVGSRLFGEDSNMEEVRNRLSSLIQTLKASSLLLVDDEDVDGFKIHDLVRGFVASVASRDDPLLVLNDNDKLEIELRKDKLKSCTAVCFPYADIKELPKELDCPEMRIFLLFTNNKSFKVPNSYFNSMRKLMVLHLSQVHLTHSLSPFQSSENLHTLCLDGCLLEDVAMIAKLKGLHILSFMNSKIQLLPKEIGQLVELRLLDLNNCSRLEIIEPGVLESLIKLEELYMENSFDRWNAVGQTPPTNARLIELNKMKNLCTLYASIPDPSMLPEDLNVEKLTKYKIQIGDVQHRSSCKGSSILELKLDPKSSILQKGCIQALSSKTDNLFFDGLNGNEQSICVLSQEGFPKLKHLQVENNPSIHYVLQSPSQIFKTLESLLLKNLINLEKICNNHISSMSFSALKVVRVESCNKMEVLFLLSLLRELPQLKEIQVVKCHLMQEIVEADDHGKVELHNLRVLELRDLPRIKNFFTVETAPSTSTSHDQLGTQVAFFNGQQVSIPSLESLTMDRLPNLEDVFAEESPVGLSNLQFLQVSSCKSLSTVVNSTSLVNLAKLQTLTVRTCDSVQEIFCLDELGAGVNVETLTELNTINIDGLPSLRRIWSKNPCGIMKFHNLKELSVKGCDTLEFLFSPSILQSLAQLRNLGVWNCKKMTAIIMEEEGSGIETSETLVFLMLTNLIIGYLENLTCFSRAKCPQEALGEDHVKSCSTTLFNQQIAFPSLESLYIVGMDKIEILWDKQVAAESFHKLKYLRVNICTKLVNIIPSCILGRLRSLESLEVWSCRSLEVVFKLQPLSPPYGDPVAHFPLKKLELVELPELKCVWDKEFHSRVKFQFLRSVTVSRCKSLTALFPTSVAVQLTHLNKLRIENCGIVEVIEKEGFVAREVFPRLTSLKLEHLAELKCIYVGTHALRWPALKTLEMDGCDKVEIFASQPENEMPVHRQPFFLIEKGAFPNLQELKLDLFGRMEMWHGHFHDGEFFCKLRVLKLHHLSEESAISIGHFVQSLTNLEELVVCESSLEKLSTIMGAKEGASPKGQVILPLSRFSQRLHTLDVSCCDELSNMFTPTIAGNLVELTKLRIRNCKMLTEVICDEGGEEGFVVAFHQLKYMELDGLTKLRCFSSIKYTLKFPLLEDVLVSRCPNMKFFSEGLLEVPKLERVRGSEETWFWKESLNVTIQNMFEERVVMSQVKSMRLFEFPELIGKWHDKLNPIKSSWQLESLTVDKCPSFTSAIPSRLMLLLENMKRLQVRDCQSLEEIFDLEGLGGVRSTRVLPCFDTLYVVNLPKLRRLWNKDLQGSLAYNCLKYLTLYNCSNLGHAFAPSMARCLPQLRSIEIKECGQMEGVITEEEAQGSAVENITFPDLRSIELKCLLNLTSFLSGKDQTLECPNLRKLTIAHCPKIRSLTGQSLMENDQSSPPLFTPQIAFPSLETLYIDDMDKIEILWDNQVAVESFHKLKSLSVHSCKKLVNIISSCILGRLRSLESLKVTSCRSLEVVFKLQPLSPPDGDPIAHFPLKKLELDELPELKCVWDKEFHSRVKFQFLRSVTVSGCKSLTALFPSSVAVQLTHLEELEISNCGIVEVIEKEGFVAREVFPRLTSLKLEHLVELRCIYARTHALRWPTLKTLEMDGCDKVEIFASQPENEIPVHRQPFFLIEKGAFPNLQELKLDLCGRMEMWHGHFHDGEFFCKLRVLKLYHLSEEFAISTCHFVQSLTNLEELVVCESYLEKLSTIMGAKEGASLEGKGILPLSRFSQHLKTLDVSCCDELSNMFTPTIAGNLVELTKLRIRNCKMLTEVICDEGVEEGFVVAFNQLKYMELDGLTKLRCFSSIKYTLKFPLLEDVIVSRCPNMKFFSEGLIEAPKLERVRGSEETWFWKENLNITIQNMFEERAVMSQVKSMRLPEFPELIGKWHSELNPIKSSWQLESLTVDKCSSFTSAIPSRLMLLLENMERLQVRDCQSLEEIFDLEGLGGVRSTRVLPCFYTLDLVNLPKLRRLWNKDLQGSLHYNCLQSLTLYNCSNLRHAFAPSMARCLPALWSIGIMECGQMEGVIAEEEAQGSAVENIIFPTLWEIELECLPNLTSFLSGKNQTLECPNLRHLTIAHCHKMCSLTGQSSMEIDHSSPPLFTPQVHFPELRWINLSHMDNLSKIWTTTPRDNLTFESLWNVKVENCKSLENLFPHWVATSLIELDELRVESCGLKEIVASGDDTSHSTTAEFLFPQLTSLMFNDMPQLKSFCTESSTLNWPCLKELRVTHCDKLSMLSFAASVKKGAQREDQHDPSDREAHFPFEMGIPKRLSLVDKDIQMIHNGEFAIDIFGKLQALTLACFHDENAVFPSRFLLQRFQNLQSLEVFCSSFEEIFPDEEVADEGNHPVFENLKELKLSKLHNLKCVWREDSLVPKILQSIESFEVWECPGLTTLFPTITSFQNLTKLVVKDSFGLVHLIKASAITNLMHLTDMTLIGCEMMKEVMENDEIIEGRVVSFGKLEQLTLQRLPSLECFSSTTTCTFRFPSLWYIEVEDCPKMKIFSKGTLSMPKLRYGTLFRYRWEEGDDLNTAIQKLSS